MGKPMKRKIFALLAILPLVTFTSFLFSDEDEDVEAVVVTGSYIKTDREEIDIPVDVFDRGEYGAAGAPNEGSFKKHACNNWNHKPI